MSITQQIYSTRWLKLCIAFGLLVSLVFSPAPAYAACGGPSFFFIEHWSTNLCEGDQVIIDDINDFLLLAFWAVDSILKLSAYVAVGFLIWGAIKYIKGQGEPGELASAKNTIVQALIGLVIAIASVAIVHFVEGAFR